MSQVSSDVIFELYGLSILYMNPESPKKTEKTEKARKSPTQKACNFMSLDIGPGKKPGGPKPGQDRANHNSIPHFERYVAVVCRHP